MIIKAIGVGLLWLVAACAFLPGSSGQASAPTVVSNSPVNGATGVPLDGTMSATFSEAMDPATLTASTFTLTYGPTAVPVAGTVVYADSTVVFRPTVDLTSAGLFTATITTEANSAAGVALAAIHTWSFTGDTGAAAGPPPVALGTAGNYAVLAQSAISGTGATVFGNLGVSPAAAASITGFSLIADASTTFATSAQVLGRVYAADYTSPTPAELTAAVLDVAAAIADAAGRAPDIAELGAGNIGGLTLAPGVYRWTSGLQIPTDVTLAGSSRAVWIFQVAQNLNMTADRHIILTGGALARNVFWEVSGAVTLGATAHFEGVILTKTAVTLGAGTLVDGRLLAQTAATITGSTVVEAAP